MESEDRSEPDVPVIELGEVSAGGGPLPVDASPPDAARRRRGRYRLLTVAGLLAIGFAGGVVMQRVTGVVPAPSPSPSQTVLTAPLEGQKFVVVPSGAEICGLTVRGHGRQGAPDVACSGTISDVGHTLITMTVDGGASMTFVRDDDTVIEGPRPHAQLRAGQHVSVIIATDRRGRHAALIQIG